jgi:hypothetical protein
MKIPNEILTAYRRLSEKMDGQTSDFPLGTTPDNFGGRHLEISDDGKMALVATDRGAETERRETYLLDDLMYWMFRDRANSKAFYRRTAQYDYAASQRLALDELGKISAEWRERLRKEQSGFRR